MGGFEMLAQVGQVIIATFIVWQLAFVDGCGQQKPPPKRPPVNFTCGKGLDEERDGQRIIGGDEAEQHSIPWQVALVSYWSGGKPFCGGTIISPFHILTAAHCTFVPAIYIRLGNTTSPPTMTTLPCTRLHASRITRPTTANPWTTTLPSSPLKSLLT